MIRIQNLHKAFGAKKILRGLDLEVERGETFVIIGRSGIGKSVTLRHIVGLLHPDSGSVEVFERDLATMTPRELADQRLQIGYLFQDGALLNWLTVEENVALPLIEHGRGKKKEIRAKVMETLGLVELAEHGTKYPDEISGGMRKRAGLARALVTDPQIVLYDEPTSGLDPISSSVINELVLDLQKRLDITQVVVTHDMQSAYTIGDRLGLVHDGQMVMIGDPESIRTSDHPAVDQFIHGKIQGPLSHGRSNPTFGRDPAVASGDPPPSEFGPEKPQNGNEVPNPNASSTDGETDPPATERNAP